MFENVDISITIAKNGASFSVAANLGYEIPAHLYSLLKSTRTLIAKAIGRETTGGGRRATAPRRGRAGRRARRRRARRPPFPSCRIFLVYPPVEATSSFDGLMEIYLYLLFIPIGKQI